MTYEKRPAGSNVDLPFEGSDGKRLGGDLVRLSGTEEGGGDAEAGDEEEKGRTNHLRFARQLCLWLVALEEKKRSEVKSTFEHASKC